MQSSDIQYSRTKWRLSLISGEDYIITSGVHKNVTLAAGSFICRPCVMLVKCAQKNREDLTQSKARITHLPCSCL